MTKMTEIDYTIPIRFPGIPKMAGLEFTYQGAKYKALKFSSETDLLDQWQFANMYTGKCGQFVVRRVDGKAVYEMLMYHHQLGRTSYSVVTIVAIRETGSSGLWLPPIDGGKGKGKGKGKGLDL